MTFYLYLLYYYYPIGLSVLLIYISLYCHIGLSALFIFTSLYCPIGLSVLLIYISLYCHRGPCSSLYIITVLQDCQSCSSLWRCPSRCASALRSSICVFLKLLVMTFFRIKSRDAEVLSHLIMLMETLHTKNRLIIFYSVWFFLLKLTWAVFHHGSYMVHTLTSSIINQIAENFKNLYYYIQKVFANKKIIWFFFNALHKKLTDKKELIKNYKNFKTYL